MESKIVAEEINVLLDYLKSGLSTRQLDEKLGYDSQKSKGYKSWEILRKYSIKDVDKNKLFCFRKQECLKIIKKIIIAADRKEVDLIFNSATPKFFDKYKDIYVIADTEVKVLTVLSGEARNITQSFFSPLKKVVGICQFPECTRTDLDTVHLQKTRPENLKDACVFGRVPNTKKYDVYKILLKYIHLHSKRKSICFLCKSHHAELSRYEKTKGKNLAEFRKKIISDL